MKHLRLFQRIFGWIRSASAARPLPTIPQPVHFETGDNA